MLLSTRMLQSFAFYYNVLQPIEPFIKMAYCFYFLTRTANKIPRSKLRGIKPSEIKSIMVLINAPAASKSDMAE